VGGLTSVSGSSISIRASHVAVVDQVNALTVSVESESWNYLWWSKRYQIRAVLRPTWRRRFRYPRQLSFPAFQAS
jgi:hypothetical protein